MINLLILLIAVFSLATRIKSRSIFLNSPYYQGTKNGRENRNSKSERLIVFIIFAILSIFAGLRTTFNDTPTYIKNFNLLTFSSAKTIDWSLGANPGFNLYQLAISYLISNNSQIFILLSALIVNYLFVYTYYKFSSKFSLSIFLFISSGLYLFTMGAMKQAFAMSIGFWALRYILEGKWKYYILIILLASTLHPYILLYLIIPFFRKEIWSKKITLLIIIFLILSVFFEIFVSTALRITKSFGDNYQIEEFINEPGMNYFRVIVFSVVPILSFIFRKQIKSYNNVLLNICINSSVCMYLNESGL